MQEGAFFLRYGNPLIPSPFFVDFGFIYYLCTDIAGYYGILEYGKID